MGTEHNSVDYRSSGPNPSAPAGPPDDRRGTPDLLDGEHLRTLFETLDHGFCVVELVNGPDGRVVDLIVREANGAFERQTGLVGAEGRRALDLLPHVEDRWLELVERVATTGRAERVESYLADLDRWHSGHYSRLGGPGSRLVAVVFEDITARRRLQDRQDFVLRLNDALRPLADPPDIMATAAELLGRHLAVGRVGYGEVDATGTVPDRRPRLDGRPDGQRRGGPSVRRLREGDERRLPAWRGRRAAGRARDL